MLRREFGTGSLNSSAGSFWVYVLENAAGKLYVGHTEDLQRRVAEHAGMDESGRKFTPKHGPWRLVWSELHGSRAEAVAREREIKRMKSARWIREHLLDR